jgi:hypothetical protein
MTMKNEMSYTLTGNIHKAFSAGFSYCFLFKIAALKHLKMPVIGVSVWSDTPPPKWSQANQHMLGSTRLLK